jgi:putative N6-adenine-specific DNA methylase
MPGQRGPSSVRGSHPGAALDLFASCAPGLESLLAGEVAALGLAGRAVPGGVDLRGDLGAVARLNLWLRTASRVLVRLGSVRATSFAALVKEARALPFELAVAPGAAVALRVTCRKSRLYHSGAVAERLHTALQERLGRAVARVEAADEADREGTGEGESAGKDDAAGNAAAPAQLLLARFDHDICTVSADASGALLHQRGYRAALSRAPLRETLAAALLLAAGYSGEGPLVDPLCGSGTLAIEAALIARRRAPGLARAFAFQRWPGHDAAAFARLLAEAREGERHRAAAPIAGSDADAGAIAAARDNARRAGVEDDVELGQRPLAALHPRPGPGLCASNPPYGKRVGAAEGDVHQLWRSLGDVARERLPGFAVALVCPDPRLAKASRLPLRSLLRTQNGGLRVELLRASPASGEG